MATFHTYFLATFCVSEYFCFKMMIFITITLCIIMLIIMCYMYTKCFPFLPSLLKPYTFTDAGLYFPIESNSFLTDCLPHYFQNRKSRSLNHSSQSVVYTRFPMRKRSRHFQKNFFIECAFIPFSTANRELNTHVQNSLLKLENFQLLNFRYIDILERIDSYFMQNLSYSLLCS